MKPATANGNNGHFSFLFAKFAVFFLVLGLAYRLFVSSFVQFGPLAFTDTTPNYVMEINIPPPPGEPPVPSSNPLVMHVENRTSQKVECDIFVGDWILDPSDPIYTNYSCSSIEHHQNCMRNGRPDTGYLYWRWKPRDCELPRFDATRFLNLMRHKSMAFIGDSITRNHVQSLLCTLSQVAKASEVYHDEEYKSRRWYMPSFNFTLSVIWSPFVTKATTFEDNNGVSSGVIQLHIDKPDTEWTQQYEHFDYIVVAGGKWFLKTAVYYESNRIVGCHNCPDKNITELGFENAYRKALKSVLSYITRSNHKVYAFFRTITPDHFENGEWNTGGYCNRTGPFKEGDIDFINVDQIMRKIELEEFQMASKEAAERGLTLKLLDTALLSLLRPDGHPGVYRQFQPYANNDKNAKIQNDCLHWCLPGPIDAWNELMMDMLRND